MAVGRPALRAEMGVKVVDENVKLMESFVMQIAQVNANVAKLTDRVEGLLIDLKEFSERFEEVVTQLEDERRLDITRDYN